MPPGTHRIYSPPDIPEHRLFQRIGQGSYGEVWLAQSVTGAWHAVKIIHRDRFDDEHPYEREFEGIRQCEPVSHGHEGLIDILQIGRNDSAGFFYYVMELADDHHTGSDIDPAQYRARTLHTDLQQRRRMPLADCLAVGRSIAQGLAHLHAHKLVHRDIKPANIVFVNGRPKLADIGLVTSMDATYSLVGTPGYIPQEGPGHPTADIYSLGKVIYEMATGNDRHAFPELPADATGLSSLNQVLLQACDRDPQQRHASAGLLAEDLQRLSESRPPRCQENVERRHRIKIGALLTLLVAAIVGHHFWEVHNRPDLQRSLTLHWTVAGTLSNTMVATGTQLTLDRQGREGGALYFNGPNAKLIASQPVTLGSATTLTCWFKGLTEKNANAPIIGIVPDSDRAEEPTSGLWLGSCITGKIYLRNLAKQSGAAPPEVETTLRISSDGAWHSLTATHDGRQIRLYLDGELQGAPVAVDALPKTPLTLRAGLGFIGALDDVRLYQRVLNEKEIRLLAAARNGLETALVAHYPLNGDGTDVSPSSDTLTLEDTQPTQNRHGLLRHAMAFDGLRAWAGNGRSSDMPLEHQPRTFAFWARRDGQQDFNRTAYNQTALLVNGYAGTGTKLGIYFQTANGTAGSVDGLTVNGRTAPVPFPANQWHHVVLAHDGQRARLFLNGTLQRNQVVPVRITSRYLFLGVNAVQSGEVSHFHGALDDLRVYSRALAASEVKALYDLERADPSTAATAALAQTPQLLFPNSDFSNGTLDNWQVTGLSTATDANSTNNNNTAPPDPRQYIKLILDNTADGRHLIEAKEWADGVSLRSPPFTVTPANRILLTRCSKPFGVGSCSLFILPVSGNRVLLQEIETTALTEHRHDLAAYLGKTVQIEFYGGWMRVDSLKTLGVAQGK